MNLSKTNIWENIRNSYQNNLIDHSSLFIDSMHIKANANKNKYTTELAEKDTLHFQEALNNEINE